MLTRMHDLISNKSQFIIATHSPILMAYPEAWIYQIGPKGLDRVAYEDTEHYQVTRDFLNRPEMMLDKRRNGKRARSHGGGFPRHSTAA